MGTVLKPAPLQRPQAFSLKNYYSVGKEHENWSPLVRMPGIPLALSYNLAAEGKGPKGCLLLLLAIEMPCSPVSGQAQGHTSSKKPSTPLGRGPISDPEA